MHIVQVTVSFGNKAVKQEKLPSSLKQTGHSDSSAVPSLSWQRQPPSSGQYQKQGRIHQRGDASIPAQDTFFFTIAPQKGKDAPLKEGNKARIRARTRMAIKARVKEKAMIRKVDRTRSPPFRLVRVCLSSSSCPAFLACSCYLGSDRI